MMCSSWWSALLILKTFPCEKQKEKETVLSDVYCLNHLLCEMLQECLFAYIMYYDNMLTLLVSQNSSGELKIMCFV